jgi:hypothetical protein
MKVPVLPVRKHHLPFKDLIVPLYYQFYFFGASLSKINLLVTPSPNVTIKTRIVFHSESGTDDDKYWLPLYTNIPDVVVTLDVFK